MQQALLALEPNLAPAGCGETKQNYAKMNLNNMSPSSFQASPSLQVNPISNLVPFYLAVSNAKSSQKIIMGTLFPFSMKTAIL